VHGVRALGHKVGVFMGVP